MEHTVGRIAFGDRGAPADRDRIQQVKIGEAYRAYIAGLDRALTEFKAANEWADYGAVEAFVAELKSRRP